jgi:hypothetical protein
MAVSKAYLVLESTESSLIECSVYFDILRMYIHMRREATTYRLCGVTSNYCSLCRATLN